jgi:hypothetical protein
MVGPVLRLSNVRSPKQFGETIVVEIFRPGSFRGIGTFDEARNRAWVERTKTNASLAGLSLLPIKVGHDLAADLPGSHARRAERRVLGANQVGWLDPSTDLWAEADGSVWMRPNITDPDALALVENGTWRWVSVELYAEGTVAEGERPGDPPIEIGESLRAVVWCHHPRHKGIRGVCRERTASSVFAPAALMSESDPEIARLRAQLEYQQKALAERDRKSAEERLLVFSGESTVPPGERGVAGSVGDKVDAAFRRGVKARHAAHVDTNRTGDR